MNFRPDLAAKVMAGEKTVTRRCMRDNPRSPWFRDGCKIVEGRSYAVCPGRGKDAIGRVRVTSVRWTLLGNIDDEEARREGFNDRQDFVEGWKAINGIFGEQAVWRVEFSVLRTPADWLALRHPGIEILDPDGWRGPGAPPFDRPLTYEEFWPRFVRCTLRGGLAA